MASLTDLIVRVTAPLRDRIALTVGRCALKAMDDAGNLQVVKVKALAGEVMDEVEVLGHWGLASAAPDGSEGVLVCVGGIRSHPLVIATEHRKLRLKELEGGEVAIYDDQGQVVHLKRDGIDVVSKGNLTALVEGETTLIGQAGLTATVAGAAKITAGAEADIQAGGAASLKAGGTVSIEAAGKLDITCAGLISILGTGVFITGAVVIDGTLFATHVHTKVTKGTDDSGPPPPVL